MDWLSNHIQDIINIITAVVTVASVVTKTFPKIDDRGYVGNVKKYVGKAQKLIRLFALNKDK